MIQWVVFSRAFQNFCFTHEVVQQETGTVCVHNDFMFAHDICSVKTKKEDICTVKMKKECFLTYEIQSLPLPVLNLEPLRRRSTLLEHTAKRYESTIYFCTADCKGF